MKATISIGFPADDSRSASWLSQVRERILTLLPDAHIEVTAEDEAGVDIDGIRIEKCGAFPETWEVEACALRAREPRHLLFADEHNATHSQIAEALARSLAPASVRVSSAGVEPTAPDPALGELLEEIDLPVGTPRASGLGEADAADADAWICLDPQARAAARAPRHAAIVHWPLPDPGGDPGALRVLRDRLVERMVYLFSAWPGGAR